MREFAKAFYKSQAWKRTREQYAKSKGGLCERCLASGLVVPGEIVHHKIYLSPENLQDLSISLDWRNLELLCRQCHADEHENKHRKRWAVSENGTILTR